MASVSATLLDWSHGGINETLPSKGGSQCAEFLDPLWRQIETFLILTVAAVLWKLSYSKLSISKETYQRQDTPWRRILLLVLCLVWGMEIGFKFASRTVIHLFNPCHLMTAAQIYLLASSPSKTTTAIFRIHLHFLNGPVLALLLPQTDSRLLPLEVTVFWIEHLMIFVVAFYLARLKGEFNFEQITDFKWNAFSYSLNVFYHFGFLQLIAILSRVNMNHMLCPAPTDPFQGRYYRVCAVIHQAFLCAFLNKLFCALCNYCGERKIKSG